MEKFKTALDNFMWEMINPALVKNKEHTKMLDNIEPDNETARLAIVDYGSAITEVTYKAGLKDGMRLAIELGVCANE